MLRLAETAGRISLRGVRFGPPVSAWASLTIAPFPAVDIHSYTTRRMCCDPGMDFDAYERRLWAGRATAYERGFARLTAHTAGALLDAAGVTAQTRLLDVGTGPGG